MLKISHFTSTLLIATLFAFSEVPAVVSSMVSHDDQEDHIEQLRGSLMLDDVHRKLTDPVLISAPLINGVCVGARVFAGIPFNASAYGNCTSFQDASAGNLGKCGDLNLALDGQRNSDAVCHARAPLGGDCHVAYTQAGESLQYSFYVNNNDPKAVFNIVLRMAANTRRTVRVVIENGSKPITKDLIVDGNGFLNFKDFIWERVQFPKHGLQNILVEFIDGQTNFCNIRVEETTTELNKTLVIPFNASAQKYITFYELSPQERLGTCGSGPVDSQPTRDKTCNDRGSNCTIAWVEAGEQVTYLVNNPNKVSMRYNVTLRLASSKNKHRRVMLQVEGYAATYTLYSSGRGTQAFDDATASFVTFPSGLSRLFVMFVDKQVNMCSITIQ